MSLSQVIFHWVSIVAIVAWIVKLATVPRRHHRMATPHHSTRRNGTQAAPNP